MVPKPRYLPDLNPSEIVNYPKLKNNEEIKAGRYIHRRLIKTDRRRDKYCLLNKAN